jgi:hypothetical protein
MKLLTAAACCLLAAVALAQGWKEVVVRDAGLTFSMPVLPQASKRSDSDQGFTVATRMWIGSQPGANYVVTASVIPANAPAGFMKNMKEGMVKGFLNSTGGKAETDKTAVYGKISGRQITFTTAAGAKGALWIVERGKKLIALTMAKKAGGIDPDRTRFFSSLRLY